MLQFVYIYKATLDQGSELRSSIRSLVKHCKAGFNVVVIGSDAKPDWLNGEYVRTYVKKAMHSEADQGRAYDLIANSSQFGDFININDDTVAVADFDETFFDMPFVDDPLTERGKANAINGGWPWAMRLWITTRLCAELKLTSHNYETHLPHFYYGEKFKEVMDEFPIYHGVCLAATAYYNYHNCGHIGNCSDVKSGVYGKGDLNIQQKNVWLNYGEYQYHIVKKFLIDSYTDEHSRFEF